MVQAYYIGALPEINYLILQSGLWLNLLNWDHIPFLRLIEPLSSQPFCLFLMLILVLDLSLLASLSCLALDIGLLLIQLAHYDLLPIPRPVITSGRSSRIQKPPTHKNIPHF